MTAPSSPPPSPPAAFSLDGQPVDAAVFYAAACDPARSVVVEACAGAGKTWMLVSRILRALLAGAQPQQILAITFTRKAAGEMRARLDEWLQQFAGPEVTDEQRAQELVLRGMAAAPARASAAALGALQAQLLAAGRAVEVRTFHGWFHQLLAGAPLALLQRFGLQPQMELLEDPLALEPLLWRRFHQAVDADAELRADYVELVRQHHRSALTDWLRNAWQRRIEFERADAAGVLEGSVQAAAERWPICAGVAQPVELLLVAPWPQTLRDAARALGALKGKLAIKTADALADAMALDDAQARFDLVWKALFTIDGDPRKLGTDTEFLAPLCDELLQLRTMQHQHQSREDHLRLVRLARVLLAQFQRLKAERGLADMADLELLAGALLADSELSAWVQERLDLRVRHLLIDEFQDTSPLQWQALHAWLAGYAGAGGGASGQRPPSVFIVGDPKQSIYRFRRAEPRVFEAARDFVRQALGGVLLACDHTRRNAPAVVEALNAVFEDAPVNDDWQPYRRHTTASHSDGQVCALPEAPRSDKAPKSRAGSWRDSLTQPRQQAEDKPQRLEAATVAQAVADLVDDQGFAPGDIMLLARRHRVLQQLADSLSACGLPSAGAREQPLLGQPGVADLLAVLDVLASPGHDLSLAQALKSPIFGASDAELLAVAQAARAASCPWAVALQQPQPALDTPALQRARGLLAGWDEAGRWLPPHDLLDRIVHESDALARLAAALPPRRRRAATQAVQALLATALDLDGGRYATPYGFVRALRSRGLGGKPAAVSDAVQLLTVHGAKGLEARAVFIVDGHPNPRQPERNTLLVDWPVDAPAPRCLAFIASEGRVPDSLVALMAEEERLRRREELNGLYVAMTRARERLMISRNVPHRAGDGGSWWERVRPQAQAWLPQAAAARHPAAPEPAVVDDLPALRWQAPPAPAIASSAGAAAALGSAVHRLLEWAGQPGAALARSDGPAAAAAAAAEAGLPPAQAARVLALARRVLDSPACKRFFDTATLLWAGNEVPLAWEGEALRIDRLVALPHATGREWWVLDYKLQSAPDELPAYREQLARYAAAVRALQPGEPVHAAFITAAGELVPLGT